MNRHFCVNCNVCHEQDLKGKRFKCLICYDFDMCESCYYQKKTAENHVSTHPVQTILSEEDMLLYYGGEDILENQVFSYTCPICNKLGLTLQTLASHCVEKHNDMSRQEVICPVCVATGGDQNYQTANLGFHLMTTHNLHGNLEMPAIDLFQNPDLFDIQSLGRRGLFRVLGRSTRENLERRPRRDSEEPPQLPAPTGICGELVDGELNRLLGFQNNGPRPREFAEDVFFSSLNNDNGE